ncbi:hypothetical protein [Novosphingobium sp.]|uniref:hypothetical protein n=1 Tax=Novosphingobium sp. TaxID=1874826 RepID=UPI00286CD3C5|nr:hypothetical protein [Novosphingobium sp.]
MIYPGKVRATGIGWIGTFTHPLIEVFALFVGPKVIVAFAGRDIGKGKIGQLGQKQNGRACLSKPALPPAIASALSLTGQVPQSYSG